MTCPVDISSPILKCTPTDALPATHCTQRCQADKAHQSRSILRVICAPTLSFTKAVSRVGSGAVE